LRRIRFLIKHKIIKMNKGDLISVVAEAAGITKAQAGSAVEAVFSGIEASLKGGDKAAFVGFGTFSTAHKPAREGRNPSTGKTISIAAKTSVKFKAGKSLTDAVN
jgi:DNA-binding protein HU-beta